MIRLSGMLFGNVISECSPDFVWWAYLVQIGMEVLFLWPWCPSGIMQWYAECHWPQMLLSLRWVGKLRLYCFLTWLVIVLDHGWIWLLSTYSNSEILIVTLVFSEMKFALNALPETFINMLQSLVSLRRIEKYLNGGEVKAIPSLDRQEKRIALQSCTLTWPQDRSMTSIAPSIAPTPKQKFVLTDLTLNFPQGELTLVCGKLGSGKTLLLLSLLGETDVLAGQLLCPHSPPDSLVSFAKESAITKDEWIVQGSTAYVPQAAWLRNASIRGVLHVYLNVNSSYFV